MLKPYVRRHTGSALVDGFTMLISSHGMITSQITNNTFVHTHNAIEFDNRGETWQKGNCDPAQAGSNPHSFFQELWRDFNASDEWSRQFPYLATIADDHPCVPVHNAINNNKYCKCDTWITATAAQITSWHSTAEGNINVSTC